MIEINRILCPIDFSDFSRRALDYAVGIARWYGSRITALHVYPIGIPSAAVAPGAPMVIEPVVLSAPDRLQLQRELAAFVDAERGGVPIETEVREGSVWRELTARAGELRADLLVLGTHGRTGFERLLLGSVAEKLVRKAPCPVLTVPAGGPEAVPIAPGIFTRILCGVDFSEPSLRALEWALSIAQEADAELVLAHVLDLSGLPGVDGLPRIDLKEFRLSYVDSSLQRLRAIVPDSAREFARVQEVVGEGRPHQQLLRIARERGTDVIVLGTSGHNAVERAFIGSTAEHVVRAAPCPVLTVRAR
jgi:nucleotide-binding universal stress UspA family protein